MILPFALCAMLGGNVPASWLRALALVESGDNPHAVGRHGERTQYQVTPKVWQMHSKVPMHRAGQNTVRGVVSEEWGHRINRFEMRKGRKPTPAEGYLLWHRPARVTKPTRIEAERARRFQNLVRE